MGYIKEGVEFRWLSLRPEIARAEGRLLSAERTRSSYDIVADNGDSVLMPNGSGVATTERDEGEGDDEGRVFHGHIPFKFSFNVATP